MSTQGTYRISFHIENAARAASEIKSIGDAMEETESKFQSSKSGIDSAEQSLVDFSSSVSQVRGPMEQLGSSIDLLGQSSQQLGSSINPLSGEFSALSDSLGRVDSSLRTSNTSLQQAGQGFATLSQQVQTSNAPLAAFGQGMLTAGQSTQQFVGVLGSVGSTLGGISGDITSAGTSLSTLNRDLESSADALRSFSSSTSSLESDMSSLVGSSSALGHAFSDAARDVEGVSGSLNEYNTLLGQTTQETDAAQSKAQTLGQAFQSQVGGITAVIGAGTSLFLMYNNLSQAQLRVETATVRLEGLQLREQKALIALNKAVQEHGANSQQAAIAMQAYEVAQGRVSVASERLNQAQIQQNVTFANFAQQIVPTVATAVGSVVSVFSNLTREGANGVSILDRLRGAFGGVGGGAAETEGILNETNNTLATMGGTAAETTGVLGGFIRAVNDASISVKGLTVAFVTNPFTLLATAAAAVIGVIAAFTYNIGGARDAINGFGEAVGNAVPFLRPLLEWLADVGEGFQEMAGTVQRGGIIIEDEFGNIAESAGVRLDEATGSVIDFGGVMSNDLPNAAKQGVDATIAELDKLILRLESPFGAASQQIIDFFQRSFGDSVKVLQEAQGEAANFGQEAGQSLLMLNTVLRDTGVNLGEVGNALKVVKQPSGEFQITTANLALAQKEAAKAGIDFNKVLQEHHIVLKPIPGTQNLVLAGNEAIEVSFETVSEKAAKVNEALAALDTHLAKIGHAPLPDNIKQMATDLLGATDSIEKFTAAQEKAYSMMRTGIDPTADLNTRYAQWKETLDSTVPSLDQLTSSFNAETGAILQMTNALAPAIQQIQASTLGMTDQKSVLDGLAPSFKASADSIILMKDGMAEILTPAQIVNSILAGQANELNNVSGLMDMYTQHVQAAGISLIDFIALLEQSGAIDKETATALEERGKALGLITEEEIKAAEATQEHVTVTQQLIQSNKELATSLAETVQGIQDGRLLTEAFSKGVMDVDKAFQDSIVSLAEVQGGILRYNELLAEGKIQSVAFAQGQHEMIQSFQAMDASMANIEGQIHAFDQLLKAGDVSLKAFNLGLREGQLDARNWFTELKNADGAVLGMETGLRELAARLGVDLPQGMSLSTEQLQQFIGVMSGSTTAVRDFQASIIETAAGITDSLVVGLRDLNDDVDDAVDELADTWKDTLGVKMPKATQEALEQIGKDKSWAEAAQYGVDQMKTVIDDPEGFADAFESVKKGLLKKMDELSPEAAAAAQKVMAAIEAVAKDPNNTELWLNVETAIDNLQQKANELDLTAPFEKGTESAVKYSQEIDNIVQKITSLQPQLKGYESSLASLALNAPGTIAPLAEPTTPTTPTTPTIDTMPAKQAMDELLTYTTNIMNQVAQTGQHVSTIWGGHFNTAVTNASNLVNTLLTNVTNAMNQIAITPQHVATSWLGHFTTASTNATTAMNTILNEAVNIMNQVAQTAQHVSSVWQGHFNTAVSAASAQMQTLLSNAVDVMNQVAQTATHVESIWSSTFSRIVSNVVSSMGQINSALDGTVGHAEAVATAVGSIGDMALEAKNSVDQLAQAINSLEDRTITITVNYVTTGTPPAGGAGGIGYFDGHTYLPMAGGSAGISGLGFAPIVIDHPTKLLVGENGPELVSVTPLSRNNGLGSTGAKSPFADISFATGTGDFMSTQGTGTQIQTDTVVFDANQGPIQILQGGGAVGTLTPGSAESPLGFGNPTNVPLGTGQGGVFNTPGGQVSVQGNAVACVNGTCFGNMQGFGPQLPSTDTTGTLGQQQEQFKPVFDENGMIKAMETLVEWFKFLGLPTGASVPGTGNFTPGTGTVTGRGAFAQAGVGAFAGQISMQGGQIVFDSNQGKMQVETTTGAISIAGPGGAFASAGNVRAGVGIFGTQDQTTEQLTQLNKTMQNVSGSLQAVGNSMASLGNEVVFGNQQMQQTFQGLNTNLQGLQTTTQQGLQNVVNGVNLFGSGSQVGFQGFTLPNGQTGGAVGAGGAAQNPLGFLSGMLGGFGINNPFQGAVPTTGGTPATGGTGTGGGIGTGPGSCSVCGAASGLQGAASDLSGVANQLGNVMTSGNGVGATYPGTAGGGIPTTGGGGGGMLSGTQPGTGAGCACSCMPMDSDPNRYKIEDGAGNDCNNHIYFNTIEECHSRLNEICPGENTNTPTPTPTTPTPQPSGPTLGGGNVSAMAQGGMAMASAGGLTVTAGGGPGILGGQQVPVDQPGLPIGNPPIPPSIVRSVGLPSQALDVNEDPESWTIVESAGTLGTYDIIDDSGDVVQLGFRTLSAAQEYLNYFISYYKWVKSGSTGIPGPVPVGTGIGGVGTGGGGIGAGGIGTGGIGTGGITAGTGNVMASAGGGGAFAQAGNAIAQAGSLLGNALGFGSGKKLGPTPVPDMPFEEIPRAQGPFRSGQDNQEPIYDNSRVRMGADVGDSGTVSMEDIESGGGYGKKPKKGSIFDRIRDRVEMHFEKRGMDVPDWAGALAKELGREVYRAIIEGMSNAHINVDGRSLYNSQKKYIGNEVGLFH